MKKLNLKNLKLDSSDLLQREALKTVFGGYSGDVCTDECTTNTDCTDPNHPTCTTFNLTISCPDSPKVKSCI